MYSEIRFYIFSSLFVVLTCGWDGFCHTLWAIDVLLRQSKYRSVEESASRQDCADCSENCHNYINMLVAKKQKQKQKNKQTKQVKNKEKKNISNKKQKQQQQQQDTVNNWNLSWNKFTFKMTRKLRQLQVEENDQTIWSMLVGFQAFQPFSDYFMPNSAEQIWSLIIYRTKCIFAII